MVGQTNPSKFHIPHPKDWADILPDLKRKDDTLANAHMDENRSWANESPYTTNAYYDKTFVGLRDSIPNPNERIMKANEILGITTDKGPSGTMVSPFETIYKDEGSGVTHDGVWNREMKSALDHQIGDSNHYKDTEIQPIEFIAKNDLSFIVGNCIKYVVRAKKKGGAEDIKKAMHYLQLELELKYGIRSEVKYQE